jgi:hypothetical protein
LPARHTFMGASHCEVGAAFRDPVEIERWLERAEQGGYFKTELRKRIRAHVATSRPIAKAEDSATESFGLMRELRAIDRYVGNHPKVWTEWSAATCKRALGEIESVVGFVETLKQRVDAWERHETTNH